MNRSIKFRVWNKKNKKFIPHWEPFFVDVNYFNWVGGGNPEWQKKYDVEFQQFTGLTDKNGKEIYEGDIITYREKMHEHGDIHSLKARVVYDDKYAAFGLTSINQDGELLMWNYFTDMVISDFEVKGNIFEK